MRFHGYPNERVRLLFIDTKVQLTSLSPAIRPFALRHPDKPAPAAVVDVLRQLMRAVALITTREKGWHGLFELGETPSWAELATKVALAHTALDRYRRFHLPDSTPLGDDIDDENHIIEISRPR